MTTLFAIILSVVVSCYVAFIAWCISQWRRKNEVGFISPQGIPKVTVLLPVRNEASAIANTISCIANQDYPDDRLELIVLDDHSTDGTSAIVDRSLALAPSLNARLLVVPGPGSKKAAVAFGVEHASGEWILTTDGDTTIGRGWVRSMMDAAADPEVRLVCGPVLLKNGLRSTLPGRIASMESAALSVVAAAGITGRHPFFCNGANMAYRREDFIKSGGYDDSMTHLSGDDTDMLRKMKPSSIRFVKSDSAIVTAAAAATWSEFLSQRQRWASKVPVSLSGLTFFFALMVWLTNLFVIAGPVLSWSGFLSWKHWLIAMSVKVFFDVILLKAAGRFFKESYPVVLTLVLQPLYGAAVTVVGLLSVTMPYRWKGRTGT